MVGEPDQAVTQLARVLALHGMVTAAWLRADPLWAPLRERSDFKALVVSEN